MEPQFTEKEDLKDKGILKSIKDGTHILVSRGSFLFKNAVIIIAIGGTIVTSFAYIKAIGFNEADVKSRSFKSLEEYNEVILMNSRNNVSPFIQLKQADEEHTRLLKSAFDNDLKQSQLTQKDIDFMKGILNQVQQSNRSTIQSLNQAISEIHSDIRDLNNKVRD